MVIVSRARHECEGYRKSFGVPISGQILAERLSNYLHAHTLYGYFRPLGCEMFISSCDEGQFRLFKIHLTGQYYGYYLATGGKGSLVAKNALENTDLSQTVSQMIPTVAYVLAKAHEEFKDKTYEMEFCIISRETNF